MMSMVNYSHWKECFKRFFEVKDEVVDFVSMVKECETDTGASDESTKVDLDLIHSILNLFWFSA